VVPKLNQHCKTDELKEAGGNAILKILGTIYAALILAAIAFPTSALAKPHGRAHFGGAQAGGAHFGAHYYDRGHYGGYRGDYHGRYYSSDYYGGGSGYYGGGLLGAAYYYYPSPYYYSDLSYGATGDMPVLEIPDAAPALPSVLSCRHSQETVTVPSEEGGTRQIRITRC
jgi:hypothetical protein